MNLLQMSFSGAVLILTIVIIRTLTIHKLPKKIFLVLWGIVLFRLLIPFSVPSAFSIYSVLTKNVPEKTFVKAAANYVIPILPQESSKPEPIQQFPPDGSPFFALSILWCIGTAICAVFFVITYLHCQTKFCTSLPVNEWYAKQWLKEHPLKRTISIKQSDQIVAPLTYGMFHPVILMPKRTDWKNTKQLNYIFLHEYVHICHFDALLKLIATTAFCIHWFNPFVWVMYLLFNRDIELACDECVIRKLGEKSTYALMLIEMEAKKSGLMPLCNNFSKNATEERITAIMKTKKASIFTLMTGIMLIASVVTVCATSSPNTPNESENKIQSQETQSQNDIVQQTSEDTDDWYKMESLVPVYTYEDLDGETYEVYQSDFEYNEENPDQTTLAEEMSVDGWVKSEYADSSFWIFKKQGEDLSYVTALMEENGNPGDETFTNDLKTALSNNK